METHVRYNSRISERDTKAMEFWFLIIGDNRDIKDISRSIVNVLGPIFNPQPSYQGVYKGTGLRYKLLNFDSRRRPDTGWTSRIFKRIVRDSDLYTRKNPSGLEIYVSDHKWE
jgi:hypothetical protein